ncbi:MAG: hypothetical protein HUJ51_02735 [Eggerthellaceae bacterium]|nr:hypothetical protein [Eggerthellaceae bacterium]
MINIMLVETVFEYLINILSLIIAKHEIVNVEVAVMFRLLFVPVRIFKKQF